MSERFPHLLSPIQVGPIELRNRVLMTAHVPGVEEGGMTGPDFIAYHRARAAGGAGLQLSGSAAVHKTGGVGGKRGLHAFDERSIAHYRQLADAVHGEGGRFLIQLGHAGATVNDTDAGRPLLAPSPIMSRIGRETPKEMTEEDIEEIIAAHATAAGYVREGGLDGVELLGAFGYLIGAFLSPFSNKRTDRYGGSLENRLRFGRRVISAVRAVLGPDRILGLRMPGDEKVDQGLGLEDFKEIAQALCQTGELDYLNVIAGTNYDRQGRMLHWAPTPAPHGMFVPLAAEIKAVVPVPVFVAGRVTDPMLAEQILRDGKADMVGMTRAQISDPDLVQKLREGRPEDIRPCVGANLCIARAMEGKPIRCFHNPIAAREREVGAETRAEQPKHVVVIGGGPAGMEAARLGAERGHRITLYEAADQLGGQLRTWAAAPMTREFTRTLEWYEGQLSRLQVAVRLGEAVSDQMLAEIEVDAIVLATGGRVLDTPGFEGQETSAIEITDPWSVTANPPEDLNILVLDEGGGRAALSAADALVSNNQVTIVTAEYAVGELVTPTVRSPLYKRLLSAGAIFRPSELISRIDGAAIITRNVHSGIETRIEDVDMLVNWQGAEASADLLAAARATGRPVHQIGDCVAPRQVHIAIAEGAMAARAI
ncbi:MAG: FAD-dependent oxidoreductase [Pseudomonadota bacterium]